MATYAAILSSQTDAESYIDTVLAGQWTNNLLAIVEQDSSASAVWVKGSWIEIGDSGVIASAATVDFEGIDATYEMLMAVFDGVRPATDGAFFRGRVGTGGTPTYQTGTVYYGNTADHLRVGHVVTGIGNASGESLSGRAEIFGHDDSDNYTRLVGEIVSSSGAGVITPATAKSDYSANTLVTALRFYMSSGNIASGRIRLYGLKKS
jgi:hypothetical protein